MGNIEVEVKTVASLEGEIEKANEEIRQEMSRIRQLKSDIKVLKAVEVAKKIKQDPVIQNGIKRPERTSDRKFIWELLDLHQDKAKALAACKEQLKGVKEEYFRFVYAEWVKFNKK